MKNPTVIIPIYNAFEETITCLNSIYKHTPINCRIILLDDASTQGIFEEYLKEREVEIDVRTEIYRNEMNLGFVKTCNHGMLQLEKSQDVILLNSDTEVTVNWIKKLSEAAYSKPKIGTVTPLTNNGTVCSVPHFFRDNQIPAKLTVDEFANLIESISQRKYPSLPTSVGFCVYIRRETIKTIGGFDEQSFGKGYGEENDFSCRAQKAGFVDILDDATFIYHKGSMSFREEKRALIEQNSTILQKKHPSYFSRVEKFHQDNPLKPIHESIRREMIDHWMKSKSTSVLHILHNGPYIGRGCPIGGTELHVQDLIQYSQDVAHWSLSLAFRYFILTAHLPGCDYEFVLDTKKTSLQEILHPHIFRMAHLQHIQRGNYDSISQALLKHGNYVVSLHDFSLIHPIFTLVDTNNHLYNLQNEQNEKILHLRSITSAVLKNAKKIFCFSETTIPYFRQALKQHFDFTIYPHGIQLTEKDKTKYRVNQPSVHNPLRLVFLGNIREHKGLELLTQLVKIQVLPNGIPLEWHIVGNAYATLPKHVVQHGSYDNKKIEGILQSISAHIVLILSIWPETYCYSMDEALNANIPTIVTPMGAIAERTLKNKTGWVIDQISNHAVLDKLVFITDHWNEYEKVQDNIAQIQLLSSKQESSFYEAIYLKESKKPTDVKPFIKFLEQNISKPSKINFFYFNLKKIFSPYLPKWLKKIGRNLFHKIRDQDHP
jgi:GT2 family glycosyltransferase/glycosyltransferase involved in cell wall biosynthesis